MVLELKISLDSADICYGLNADFALNLYCCESSSVQSQGPAERLVDQGVTLLALGALLEL